MQKCPFFSAKRLLKVIIKSEKNNSTFKLVFIKWRVFFNLFYINTYKLLKFRDWNMEKSQNVILHKCWLSLHGNKCQSFNPKRAGLFWPISQPEGGGFRPPPLKISETDW